MDAAGHLFDRHAVSCDRVPDADEADLDILADSGGRIAGAKFVPYPLVGTLQFEIPVAIPAIGPVGRLGQAIEFGFVIGRDEPLAVDQPHHDPDRERTAAETEAEQLIVLVAIIAACKFIQRDDVAPEAEAEGAAQNGPRLERGGSDAVVIERDLVVGRKIQRLVGAPDVGAPHLRRGIAGAVREQDDLSAHAIVSDSSQRVHNLWWNSLA
jgi:hypothetical protein